MRNIYINTKQKFKNEEQTLEVQRFSIGIFYKKEVLNIV